MGCDVHFYVEYTYKDKLEVYNKAIENGEKPKDSVFWRCFGSRMNPGRNYSLFGILSKGVRGYNNKGFDARGLPSHDNLGFYAMDDSRLFITGSGEGDNVCTLETALDWQKRLNCKIYYNNENKATFVDNPDHHSHSWLTTKEFEKALRIYKTEEKFDSPVEYAALLSAMKTLEKSGHYVARVVFWFDN